MISRVHTLSPQAGSVVSRGLGAKQHDLDSSRCQEAQEPECGVGNAELSRAGDGRRDGTGGTVNVAVIVSGRTHEHEHAQMRGGSKSLAVDLPAASCPLPAVSRDSTDSITQQTLRTQ